MVIAGAFAILLIGYEVFATRIGELGTRSGESFVIIVGKVLSVAAAQEGDTTGRYQVGASSGSQWVSTTSGSPPTNSVLLLRARVIGTNGSVTCSETMRLGQF